MKVYDPDSGKSKFVYTCAVGETAESVARKFLIPAERLKADNNLTEELRPGCQIFICGGRGNFYRVKAEDDVYSIAARFGTDAAALFKYNRCKFLYPGMIIYFPDTI